MIKKNLGAFYCAVKEGDRMKRIISVLLTVCVLAGALAGCGASSKGLSVSGQTKSAVPDETESTLPVETEPPVVAYDPETQTLTVRWTTEYAGITIPEEAAKARVLEVYDSDFTLSVYLPALREKGLDEQTELPAIIDRTAQSLRFLRQYLRENAGAAYPSYLAELPVDIRIDRNAFSYQINEDQIALQYLDAGTHREFLYLLALMNSDAVGWEQIGYAWYVGTCIDPYSEATNLWPIVPELPYYPQCIAAGVDPENMTGADFRTVYDACARVCFIKGLTHWGSYCESSPVTAESVFTRKADQQPGDTLLTAFTAASFLAWLDEAHGFEQLSLFCFGQKSFEDAFGMDFQSAFDAWREWIERIYPAE